MTKDRLAEFRSKVIVGGGDTPTDNITATGVTSTNIATVIEMQRLDNELETFFNQVADVNNMIEDLKMDVDKVKSLHSKILATPVPDERQKSELDDLMSTVKTSSKIIQANLKDMAKGNFIAEEEESGSATIRIRKIQHSALLRNFIDVINQYQQDQTEHKDRCKWRIKRHFSIIGTKVPDNDVEDMIEQGNWSVFTQEIVMETEQARQVLADVESRHNDIIKLETSLKELHDLYLDMALLVESQGEIVDRIETHVTGTQDYVEKAQGDIKQAKKFQEKARKKKIYMIIFLAIIAVVLFPVAFFFLP